VKQTLQGTYLTGVFAVGSLIFLEYIEQVKLMTLSAWTVLLKYMVHTSKTHMWSIYKRYMKILYKNAAINLYKIICEIT
jgi:hypothetical protein